MLILRSGSSIQYDLTQRKTLSLEDRKSRFSDGSELFFSPSIKKYEASELKISKYTYRYTEGVNTLLWNTVSDSCVLLNQEENQRLAERKDFSFEDPFFSTLFELGFLVRIETDETFFVNLMRHEFSYSYPKNNHVDIEILPTQQCNARCFYCFKKDFRSIVMSESTVQQVIDYLLCNITCNHDVRFIWFGGEPLMAETIIDEIIEGVNSKLGYKLQYRSSINTNGSLLTNSLIGKMKEKWNVDDVLITLDGYREEHNRRKNYYNNADSYTQALRNIRDLLDNGIHTTCRINMDKDNINNLEPILDDLIVFRENDNLSVQITTLRDTVSDTVDKKKYFCPEDYYDFYHYSISELCKRELFGNPITKLPIRYRVNCIAGSLNKIVINANGKLFRCVQDSMNDEDATGDCEKGIIINNNYAKWYSEVDDLGDDCNACKLLPCCHGGCKLYRLKPRPDTTKCLRTKYYLDIVFREIIKKYGEN